MKKKLIYLFSFMMIALLTSAFLKPQNIETPQGAMLGPLVNIKGSRSFQRLTQSEGTVFEKAKIEYLISRVRESPHLFIRNGQKYKGGRAAMHLLFKYKRKSSLIKTARDFIDYLASKSSASGELYQIQFADGGIYPTRDILLNELHYLEGSLLK